MCRLFSFLKVGEYMKVNIVYYTATGNTEEMAQHIQSVLEDQGMNVRSHYVSDISPEDALDADLLVLGSPAMGVEEIEEYEFRPFFDEISSDLEGKNVILFGSYDWGDGEWMDTWSEETESFGANVLARIKVVMDPDAEDLEEISSLLEGISYE